VTSTHPALLAFLEQQRAEYRASLPERLRQIGLLWRQVQNGETPAQALASLERCAHSLAGSGATFGCAAVGDAARALELAINPLLHSAHALSPEATLALSEAVKALECSFSGMA
jgi:HPt (histidine-containing phosphotransfer) domain-containing protein